MNRQTRAARKLDARIEALRFAHGRGYSFAKADPGSNAWGTYHRLQYERQELRASQFTARHARPKHDALVARIAAHRAEVKGIRRNA